MKEGKGEERGFIGKWKNVCSTRVISTSNLENGIGCL